VPADTSHGALAGILADVRRRSFDFNPVKGAGLTAGNYRQHLAATLAAGRYTVAADTAGRGGAVWQLGLTLRGIGRAGAEPLRPVADTARAAVVGGHASYQQPGFSVDYDNTEAGVRQTYRLAARPAGIGPVQVSLALATALRAEASADTAVVFSAGSSHAPVLHYGSLRAWDATGRRLPATLRLSGAGRELALVVDDATATYPLTIDPLASTAGATLNGGAAGDTYATSIALVGDLNGDGYGDLAVGAPGYSGGAGAVYLYRGSSTGLSTTAATLLQGSNTDNFGASVAGAGDFNGDGYGDLLIGGPGYAGGIGVAYVYGGGSSFFTNPLALAAGRAGYTASRGGTAVAGVGDVNGDGYDDFAYGCPAYSSNAGDVALVFGNGSLNVNTTTDFLGSGSLRLGASLTGLGDLNGDGYADLAAGAPGANAVLVVRGANATLASGLSNFVLQPGGAGSGTSVAGPGDLNGDGYADLLIGAPGAGTGGVVYVYQGSTTLAAGTAPTATLANPNAVAGDQYGQAVSGAGDTNGDGYADFAVGSPGYSGGDGKGRAYMYGGTGTAGTYATALVYTGEASGDRYGSSLSGGDVNGDGYGDLLIGAPNRSSSTGRAYAYYGSPAAQLATPTATLAEPAAAANDYFGYSVASAGDVDGDGYADVLVGAYGTSSIQGRAYLYRGSASGLAAAPAATLTEPAAASGNSFGYSVASAGDVNGDGYADVLVGNNVNGSSKGKVYLYLGSGSGLATTPAASLADPALADNSFGYSVASAGDVDGDGYSDVLVGAYGTSSGQGRAYLYRGSASGLAAAPAATLTDPATTTSDSFGYSVASAGDVDGDGYSDVLVGAYNTSGGQGRAYLYRGSASGLATTPAATLTDPAAANDRFGFSVASAGDVDGDGYSDVLVGAYNTSSGQGRAYLYRGSAAGLGTTPAATLTDPAATNYDYFGYSVASAGDVDGDGYADVLVGAFGTSSNQGKSYLYRGGSAGLGTTPAVPLADPATASTSRFGRSVASAGDVDGDGYADVLVGASATSNNQGRTYLYRGNQGASRAGGLRLYNTNYTPIGASNRTNPQFGLGLTARNVAGRIQARVVWEVVGQGTSFSHASPITNSTAYSGRGAWTNLPASGTAVELRALATKVSHASKVRARLEYASSPLATGPASGTGGPASRVRYGPWTYVAAQQAGQSTSAATPLPVVLMQFTATASGPTAVAVHWTTASEVNSARFEVQRSADGIAWVALGSVATGSSTGRAYAYLDGAAPVGLSYYRLRQVDLDGTAAYSPVRTVTLAGAAVGLSLYPNPAYGGAATLLGAQPGAAVTVLDALGRLVASATADAAGTAALALPAGLPTGVYVVRAGQQALRLTVE